MTLVFVFAVVLGITAGTSNAKAASTKNFKGNLNVTYKNSEWKSKITIKKVNSKKVSINVKSSYAEGNFTGKITSKNTIKMNTGSKYAKVSFKWIDKSHFKTIWKEHGENIDGFISNFSSVLYNNTKYAQVKKSNTKYYNSHQNTAIKLKRNKIVVKGNLTKGTKYSNAEVQGKTSKLKKATRTFKLDKSFKAYAYDGYYGEYQKLSKKKMSSYMNGKSGGLFFVLTVKNGKVTRIDFYS